MSHTARESHIAQVSTANFRVIKLNKTSLRSLNYQTYFVVGFVPSHPN